MKTNENDKQVEKVSNDWSTERPTIHEIGIGNRVSPPTLLPSDHPFNRKAEPVARKPFGYLRLKDAMFFYEVEANDERILQMGFVPLYTHPDQPVQPAAEVCDLQADINACLRFTTAQANQIAELHKVNEQLLEALKELMYARTDKAEGMADAAIAAAEAEKARGRG